MGRIKKKINKINESLAGITISDLKNLQQEKNCSIKTFGGYFCLHVQIIVDHGRANIANSV